MGKLSVVVLTKNSAKEIEKCLKSLVFADEVIVIDDGSTDSTLELARKNNAKIFSHELKGDFANQRNYGLAKAKFKWVFFVDSDEIVTQELAEEVLSVAKGDTGLSGYFIKRQDQLWGRELSHGDNSAKLLRLGRKDEGLFRGAVHEVWDINGQTGNLNAKLLHYPHQTLVEFLQELNFYSGIRAEELYEEKQKVKWYEVVVYPVAKFLKLYILKKGFLDREQGFIAAISMSFYSFLVRAKLWELYEKGDKKRK